MNKQEYIKKIEESDLHKNIKKILINKYESFDEHELKWIIDNLQD
jgi:hypothetical protein